MAQPDAAIVVRIAGEDGEGTITLGDLFTRIAAYSGLEILSFRTYPAEIRGGQVMYQTRLGTDRVMTEGDEDRPTYNQRFEAVQALAPETTLDAIFESLER